MSKLSLVRIKHWAVIVKRDIHALWFAARDQRTPSIAKVLAAAIAAYALSPIDLIPDFIPIIGYLDDVILVPLGIMLVIRLIPPDLMVELRKRATESTQRPMSRFMPAMVVTVWVSCLLLLWRYFAK